MQKSSQRRPGTRQSWDIIPVDLNLLIETRSYEVDEFEITGELLPFLKSTADEEVALIQGKWSSSARMKKHPGELSISL